MKIKKLSDSILLLPLLTVVLWACNNDAPDKPQVKTPLADSSAGEVYHRKDSTPGIKQGSRKDSSKEDYGAGSPAGNLGDIFDDYIGKYNKLCLIDTTFKIGSDLFRLHQKYYCLMDSAIRVPKKYVYMYKVDSFVTHNFASDILLVKNNKEILRETLYKKDFQRLLPQELKAYGALFCPELEIKNDSIWLDYSISIPLTDVGIGVHTIIDKDGRLTYSAL
jgi:hypothetical protein